MSELREKGIPSTEHALLPAQVPKLRSDHDKGAIEKTACSLFYIPTLTDTGWCLNTRRYRHLESDHTQCLINQIVGPVCRRVVYWLDHEKPHRVGPGERIGMMKFGSRLDMLFPKSEVHVVVEPGQRVRAGETVIAFTGHHSKGME